MDVPRKADNYHRSYQVSAYHNDELGGAGGVLLFFRIFYRLFYFYLLIIF